MTRNHLLSRWKALAFSQSAYSERKRSSSYVFEVKFATLLLFPLLKIWLQWSFIETNFSSSDCFANWREYPRSLETASMFIFCCYSTYSKASFEKKLGFTFCTQKYAIHRFGCNVFDFHFFSKFAFLLYLCRKNSDLVCKTKHTYGTLTPVLEIWSSSV